MAGLLVALTHCQGQRSRAARPGRTHDLHPTASRTPPCTGQSRHGPKPSFYVLLFFAIALGLVRMLRRRSERVGDNRLPSRPDSERIEPQAELPTGK